MTQDSENIVLTERLVVRRLDAPGVLNVRQLRRWRERFHTSIGQSELVQRLLLRMATFFDAQGEAMVWARGAWEVSETIIAPAAAAPAMSTAQGAVPAFAEQTSSLAANVQARWHSPGVVRTEESLSRRLSTAAGLIDTTGAALPLQARALPSNNGYGPSRVANISSPKTEVGQGRGIQQRASVVPLLRTRASRTDRSSHVITTERVWKSETAWPALLFRKRAAVPAQPSQIQEAAHDRSGHRSSGSSAPASAAIPAQMAPPDAPPHAPINVARLVDEIEYLLEQRSEIEARRRGRAWRS